MWSFIGPPTQGPRSRCVSTMAIPWRFPAPPRGAMDSSRFSPRTLPNPPTILTGQGWAGSGFCAISHGLLFFWGDCQIDHPPWISQAETTAIIFLENLLQSLYVLYNTKKSCLIALFLCQLLHLMKSTRKSFPDSTLPKLASWAVITVVGKVLGNRSAASGAAAALVTPAGQRRSV